MQLPKGGVSEALTVLAAFIVCGAPGWRNCQVPGLTEKEAFTVDRAWEMFADRVFELDDMDAEQQEAAKVTFCAGVVAGLSGLDNYIEGMNHRNADIRAGLLSIADYVERWSSEALTVLAAFIVKHEKSVIH